LTRVEETSFPYFVLILAVFQNNLRTSTTKNESIARNQNSARQSLSERLWASGKSRF
jgi:hypothetical protein